MGKKTLSRTSRCGAKVMLATMRFLAGVDGSVSVAVARNHVAGACSFNEWELADVNGRPRWFTFLSFYSTRYAAAGLIGKKRNQWFATEAGSAALASSSPTLEEDLLALADDTYYNQKMAGVVDESAAAAELVEEAAAVSRSLDLDEIRERSAAGFADYIRGLSPYQFQDLVAALLRAMGYFTPFVAPKGKDGGVDVMAFRDPLGATSPRLKVQIKHYPDSHISVDVVRQMSGLLTKEGDAGVVVSSGSFTSEAQRVARESHRSLRLIDGVELVELWCAYYNKMADEDKSLMPVASVAFVAK